MSGVLIAVFVTSVLGSTHCVGMCGPFVALAGSGIHGHSLNLLFLYHLGRLISYALLGAMAGFLGYGVFGLGELAGISGVIFHYTGLVLIGYGLSLIWSQLFHQQANLWWVPILWQRIIRYGYRSTRNYSMYFKSLMIGFYSGFLPCGWLYAFVMLAIGTQSLIYGTGILVFFWLGTVPALTGFSLGINHLGTWFKSRTQIMSAGICIVFGIMAVFGERPACCQFQQTKPVPKTILINNNSHSAIVPQLIKRPCCQP